MKLTRCMVPHCGNWAPKSSGLCLEHFQALPRPLFRLIVTMKAGADQAKTPDSRRYCLEQFGAYRRQAITQLTKPHAMPANLQPEART